jgi:sulfite exporter TauE/SafE
MTAGFLTALAIGFLLGIRHAAEPDHVIAVSTIASRSKSLVRAALTGVFWGIGHTITLLAVGLLVIGLKTEIAGGWALTLEFLVGLMLVYLGLSELLARTAAAHVHVHAHTHDGVQHGHFHTHDAGPGHRHSHKVSHLRSMAVGMVHGVAGSGALVVMTMSTVTRIWEAAIYILVFGAGTIVGMLVNTTIIGLPFVLGGDMAKSNRHLRRLTAVVSAGFGLYYMYDIGITEGLFRIWLG